MKGGLSEPLASSIWRWIADEELAEGTSLPERTIAERFRVSRTPVREALLLLADQGWVAERPDGGYAVKSRPTIAPLASLTGLAEAAHDDEDTYLRIAEDRLASRLPERVTESELMRRYGLTRARLVTLLRRVAGEGWIERLPGKGWQFLPVLNSGSAYDQGYRLRILLEPPAILEPTFRLDTALLQKCRAEQKALVDGAFEWASPAQLFDANARLHEVIAGFSGNLFICESLRRVNRLRRLMEYRKAVDRQASARRCKEHLTLIDLLLSGQREAAADFMRLHLRDAAREKAGAVLSVTAATASDD